MSQPHRTKPVNTRPPLPHAGEYRSDGWPLCPRCGSDELASTVPIDFHVVKGCRKANATDPMKCLYCHWDGDGAAAPIVESV